MKTDYITAKERLAPLENKKTIFQRIWIFLTTVQEF